MVGVGGRARLQLRAAFQGSNSLGRVEVGKAMPIICQLFRRRTECTAIYGVSWVVLRKSVVVVAVLVAAWLRGVDVEVKGKVVD